MVTALLAFRRSTDPVSVRRIRSAIRMALPTAAATKTAVISQSAMPTTMYAIPPLYTCHSESG